MKTFQIFDVTNEHLKLLKNMCVDWYKCEFGAPCINPKKPYGNSDVINDIHKILTNNSGKPTDEEIRKYKELHLETRIALQIILITGQFKIGKYICEEYGEWREYDRQI